jgi:hypothetical protein
MGDWTETYNDIFFISIASSLFLFLGTLVKYAFRSKCDDISLCCGLLHIHRRVELETDPHSDEETKTEQPSTPTRRNNI